MVFACGGCGAVADDRLIACPRCSQYGTFSPVLVRPVEGVYRDRAIRDSVDLVTESAPAFDLGPWAAVFGALPRSQWSALVFGSPGLGKSTLALRFGRFLCGRGLRVLYNAIEEGFGESFRRKLRELECQHPELKVCCIGDMYDVALAVRETKPDLVVWDSVSETILRPADWARLQRETNVSVLLTAHAVKDGDDYVGKSELAHAVDVVLHVTAHGRATVKKSRYGAVGEVTFP